MGIYSSRDDAIASTGLPFAFTVSASGSFVLEDESVNFTECLFCTEEKPVIVGGKVCVPIESGWFSFVHLSDYGLWLDANTDTEQIDGYIALWNAADVTWSNFVLLNPEAITGISISAPDSVTRGLFIQISATVTGTGDFDPTCTATISGANNTAGAGADSYTSIVKLQYGQNFRLYCAKGETADEITVTVTSVQNPAISASKTIAVVGDIDGGDDPDNPDPGGGDDPDTPGGGDDSGGEEPTITAEQLRAAYWKGFAAGCAT